jgi:hypothetical protein
MESNQQKVTLERVSSSYWLPGKFLGLKATILEPTGSRSLGCKTIVECPGRVGHIAQNHCSSWQMTFLVLESTSKKLCLTP